MPNLDGNYGIRHLAVAGRRDRMVENVGSTVPGRHLGRLLGKWRSQAALTVEGAARTLKCTPQKLWRIETGTGPVRGRDVRAICELYGVPEDVTARLVRLAAEVGSKGWWHTYGDPPSDGLDLYAGLEAEACRLREYHHGVIPPLLQTRGYASALLAQRPDLPPGERDRLVAARLDRQSKLHRSLPAPPSFGAVLSENVLLAEEFGPAVLGEQLRDLVAVGQLPHVSIRVLPLDTGLHPGGIAGPFVLLDFPPRMRTVPEPSVVYQESLTGALYLDRAAEIAAYEKVWASLDALALDEDQSRHLIGKLGEQAGNRAK